MRFSIIIPVYNRPEELDELLQSIVAQEPFNNPEVIVVEDGSEKTSSSIVKQYEQKLQIHYCFKKNSGPGDSRNYGMERASGAYFILLDSDCILPKDYLSIIQTALEEDYVDAFGGPDEAHESFSSWQKAINYSMTSLLTTGGLRNTETPTKKFQLRSFNMGLSKKAFALTGGFSKQRIGEDIDLNFKLLKKGCSTRLIAEAFVWHKRRTSLTAFFKQTNNFGAARPVLNKMYSGSSKLSYWLPSLYVLGFFTACILLYFGFPYGIMIFALYTLMVMIDAFSKTKSVAVSLKSVLAVYAQFFGYGLGFLRSVFRLYIQGKDIRAAFPGMFS
ncbi:glycosyltransferase [Lutimonas sp.]|uniref:glycosyltransferase n=1 Tax=Lutimonas sp. TaxID=1872403 RepID=UPI003C750974